MSRTGTHAFAISSAGSNTIGGSSQAAHGDRGAERRADHDRVRQCATDGTPERRPTRRGRLQHRHRDRCEDQQLQQDHGGRDTPRCRADRARAGCRCCSSSPVRPTARRSPFRRPSDARRSARRRRRRRSRPPRRSPTPAEVPRTGSARPPARARRTAGTARVRRTSGVPARDARARRADRSVR